MLSTRRLLALISVLVVAAAAGIASVSALGSSAETPPPKPLDQALEDALSAPRPTGITARVRFTNGLLPSSSLSGFGIAGSALLQGASGRFWWSSAGGRIELQSDSGDTQIVWNTDRLTVYDSSSNTAYELALPAKSGESGDTEAQPPTLADIDRFLARLGEHTSISAAVPTDVAGEPSYSAEVRPLDSQGLLGGVGIAWDALHGVPLDLSIFARGRTSPVLSLALTDISFGPVSSSDLSIQPPADAKLVDLGGGQASGPSSPDQKVTGLADVQAALPFPLSAPDTIGGLPREHVQLLGGTDPGALVLYGHGLGTIAVVERAASADSGQLAKLPEVKLGALTGHELATPLGTLVAFDAGSVGFIVAGSIPPATAEAAAQGLQ